MYRGIDILRIDRGGPADAPTVVAPILEEWFGAEGTTSARQGLHALDDLRLLLRHPHELSEAALRRYPYQRRIASPQRTAVIVPAARKGPNGTWSLRPRRRSTISTTPTTAP